MKKSYKKMLIFQLIVFIIFILNSFVSNILGGYNFILFLILSLILFKYFFGFERNRYRYTKDAIFEVIIFLLIFFIVFYLSGLVITFARAGNYYTFYGFKTFIIPMSITIILKEILRYMMLKKCEDSKILIFIVFVLFSFLDMTESLYYNSFTSNYGTFLFVALSLLPTLSKNAVFNYLSLKVGYKPIIVYLLVTSLYVYLIPIIPNPNEYITAIIQFLLPILLWMKLHNFFEKEKDDYISRDYKKTNIWTLVVPIVLTVVIVYFTSGYFHYYALAIASGSMEPVIRKGDIVIVDKVSSRYDRLKKGQVLVYKYNSVIVVHRIIKIVNDKGKYYFYTKGDANGSEDNYEIPEENVIGITKVTIPFLGLPTVWLNEQ